MITVTITETDHCRRAESLLQNLLPTAPLSYIRKMFKAGNVTAEGKPVGPDEPLVSGRTVALKESERLRQFLGGRKPDLDVLFEDQWIIVFNKPAGVPVHRAAEVDEANLVEMGQKFLRRRDRIPDGSPMKLRPVNRLDRGTSGAIVLAKSPTAAGIFGRMVKEEGFGKLYLALAEGNLPQDGTIVAPLEGKESETRYRVLYQGKGEAFTAVFPVTGRMHQIRQHFRLMGHPIVGDRRYGGHSAPDLPGHGLHSFRTSFTHPVTGIAHAVHAPIPPGFLRHLKGIADGEYDSLLQSLAAL